ncbi:MAG: hypothetical protein NVS3B21_16700 [Acidimicrobiales bacterium]
MASAAALVAVRGSATNTRIALLMVGAVMVVSISGLRVASTLASLSAVATFHHFHTLPYHWITLANRSDALATVVLGLVILAAAQLATSFADAHSELVLLLAAAVLSQAVPQPARFLVEHRALDVSLAVLVFSTAVAIPPSAFRGVATNSRRLVVALVSTAVILPGLSWTVSRLVPILTLRRGVLAVGLAPAEIASVATTSLAGGDGAAAAGILVGSTLLTVIGAGVGLRLLGGGGAIRVLPLLTNLALVVGAPMAVGIALRTQIALSERQDRIAERISVAVVTLLVWLVASQVTLSRSYVEVTIALVLFLVGSAGLGTILGVGGPRPVATALLLTTSMRDFAVAAGIAVAAFGSASAAPLGLYGVIVIGWGMTIASLRTREAERLDSHVH